MDFMELEQSSSPAAPPAGCVLGLLLEGAQHACALLLCLLCLLFVWGSFGVGWGCEAVKT